VSSARVMSTAVPKVVTLLKNESPRRPGEASARDGLRPVDVRSALTPGIQAELVVELL